MLRKVNCFSVSCLLALSLFNSQAISSEQAAVAEQSENSSSTESPKMTVLTPFNAKYKVSKGRLNLGSAKRQLSQIGENRFTFSYFSDLSFLILSDHRRETSELTINEGNVTPIRYLFKREGTGSDKSTTLSFTDGQILDSEENAKIEAAENIHWYDEISYQLQMKMDLAAGKTEMKYYLIDHKKRDKLYHFKVVAEEIIEVPAGKINTVKLQRIRPGDDRLTEFWLAPDLGYLLVRIRQERDGSEVADAQLEKYVFTPM
ncbi:DUF3108 domain-containing protein [Catenovulum sp. 2E275]|uniref:DUF3108 domain-containing protein n=1 Tax=Catenovulum sp. 2E275 TaxID=2980497 RepID=UPI0021CF6C99|nr:DUF3108 domain-containing protein [Catenovulum sp. 2E275]MCU4674693.1 DUF3108 domain-containing protein [Catenovulum sp. 2E275]